MRASAGSGFPSRHFAAASLLIIGGAVLLDGLFTAMRKEMEPLSSAEQRCAGVFPENGVGPPGWYRCVEREAAEDGFEAALPSILIGVACLFAAAFLRSERPEATVSLPVLPKPPG